MFLRPASEGTGVIAGGGVRAVLELAGIRDVLAKSLGTTNPINMAKATVVALKNLRRPEDVARMRGLTIAEVLPTARQARGGGERRTGGRRRRRRRAGRGAEAPAADESLVERARDVAGRTGTAAETITDAAEALADKVKDVVSSDEDEERKDD